MPEWHLWTPSERSVPSGTRQADLDSGGIHRPTPGKVISGPGHWRTAATPRTYRQVYENLARANGWGKAETEERIAAAEAAAGRTTFVPKTKKVKCDYRRAQAKNSVDVDADFLSRRTDGDYLRDEFGRVDRRKASLRQTILAAMEVGMMSEEDGLALLKR